MPELRRTGILPVSPSMNSLHPSSFSSAIAKRSWLPSTSSKKNLCRHSRSCMAAGHPAKRCKTLSCLLTLHPPPLLTCRGINPLLRISLPYQCSSVSIGGWKSPSNSKIVPLQPLRQAKKATAEAVASGGRHPFSFKNLCYLNDYESGNPPLESRLQAVPIFIGYRLLLIGYCKAKLATRSYGNPSPHPSYLLRSRQGRD